MISESQHWRLLWHRRTKTCNPRYRYHEFRIENWRHHSWPLRTRHGSREYITLIWMVVVAGMQKLLSSNIVKIHYHEAFSEECSQSMWSSFIEQINSTAPLLRMRDEWEKLKELVWLHQAHHHFGLSVDLLLGKTVILWAIRLRSCCRPSSFHWLMVVLTTIHCYLCLA